MKVIKVAILVSQDILLILYAQNKTTEEHTRPQTGIGLGNPDHETSSKRGRMEQFTT